MDLGDDIGIEAGVNVSAESTVNLYDDSGAFGVANAGYNAADCLADDTGHFVSVQGANWGANDISDEATVYALDAGCPGHQVIYWTNDH